MNHRGIWVENIENIFTNANKIISSTITTILSAYFSYIDFIFIKILPQKLNYKTQFYTKITLLSIITILSLCCPKLKVTAAHLHINNSEPYHSRLSIHKIEEYKFICVSLPSDSFDLTPCDFLLFGIIKSQLKGKIFFNEDSVKRKVI
jgi:hypothetical protein